MRTKPSARVRAVRREAGRADWWSPPAETEEDEAVGAGEGGQERARQSGLVVATGKAAFFLFLYLEVLDASFSFDGVIGAFAISTKLVIIALGLGIGAMYIRSLTVFLV